MVRRNAREVWEAAKGKLQLQVNRSNYDTFIKNSFLHSHEDGLFVIGVQNNFHAQWFDQHKSRVKKALSEVLGRGVDVRVVVAQPKPVREPAPASRPIGTLPTEWPKAGAPSPAAIERAGNGARLKPASTFGTFVVGKSNRFAVAAAKALAEGGAAADRNPLFIYGAVGLGKTHLLHAIAHTAHEQGRTAIYVSAEQFLNEFVNAIRANKNDEFRQRYRSVDFLLVDDIQFIAGKEQTQEEFFHTFNDLHGDERKVVLTSDRQPRALPQFQERLRSRFEWGLTVEIQPPDYETRVAILRNKAERLQVQVPPDVLDFIAERVQDNIRELEGALNRLLHYAGVDNARLTVDLAALALNEILATGSIRSAISPQMILDAVSEYYGIEVEVIRGKKRDKETATARQVAMYLIRDIIQEPLAEIGKHFGGRHHTTVMHDCETISVQLQSNGELRRDLQEVRGSLFRQRMHA
jgi:chromosomal replication initiator protein